jgi:hypothetical protein
MYAVTSKDDVLQTGIGRYKNFNEARTEARQWPELEGIQYEA